ncbi:MAG: phosphate ABC transporter substrate-binding protein [Planctomycetaceae bacterium]
MLTGSSTVAPLMIEIAKRFEDEYPGVRIDVQTGGSSRGISDARRGLAEIGMVSRDLKASENDLHPFAVARDGICLIVHRENPVTELSREQIIAIYSGKTRNWKQVGGPDEPITVVNKAEGRSTLELFLKHFKLKNSEIRADVIIGDNEQGIKTVAGNPYAIGYVSIGTAEYDAGQGVPIKLLQLNGITASVENVRNRSYPLSRTLNLVTKGKPQGLVKEFLEFAQSAKVNDIVKEQYFVPLAK